MRETSVCDGLRNIAHLALVKVIMINRVGLVGILVLCASVLGLAGKLQNKIHEFQQFHDGHKTEAFNGQLSSPVDNPQDQMMAAAWSQQDTNEINAFAEMLRQQYNQMIQPHSSSKATRQPLTYSFFDLPNGYTWNNFFNIQLQHRAKEISQQVIQNIQLGTLTENDVTNPYFFVHQAANELNKIYANENHGMNQQQHQVFSQNFGHDQEQLEYQTAFIQENHPGEYVNLHEQVPPTAYMETYSVPSDMVKIYNPISGQFEYYLIKHAEQDNNHEQSIQQLTNAAQSRTENHQVSSVYFDKEYSGNNERDFQENDHLKPVLRRNDPAEKFVEIEPKITTTPANGKTLGENYYANTYEQQPIYDMQLIENKTDSAVKRANVMSLVRQRTTKNTQTLPDLAILSSSTSTTTTTEATTVSNVMSMLPHKTQTINYTDANNRIRQELAEHLKNLNETAQEETHFMGMTSNVEHAKLSYDTIDDVLRGDQPSSDGPDFVSEEVIESEPGIGVYSINKKPSLSVEPSNTNAATSYNQPTPSSLSPYSSTPQPTFVGKQNLPYNAATYYNQPTLSSLSPHSSTPQPTFVGKQNLPYNAILADIPTTTRRLPNANYFAPLAEFPPQMHDISTDARASQQVTRYSNFSEINEFNQETLQIEDSTDMQHYEDLEQFEDAQTEDIQQSYVDVGNEWSELQQSEPKNSPLAQVFPSQANRITQLTNESKDEISTNVYEITTSTPTSNKPKKKWLQRWFG
ncbi:uncharacterized protein LOC128742427 isoform X2 [Sabethes cyaneus]|uniref:uncharacterized protein LOC128742427 isoform X2 n=1 Tax=Sabethes cyaneus TaxID=53552 RepID=UPI00237DCAE2|nr:uncharacterized protein LOC128742427 isoform X2 [Sabethes cyaneus]